jgi:hypothetical protein
LTAKTKIPLKAPLIVVSLFLVGWALFLTVFLENVAPVSYKRTDYNPTYFGLRAVLEHQNPYSQALATRLQIMAFEDDPIVTPEQLATIGAAYTQPFLYPLAPSLMFVPFTLLPPELSAFLMRFVNIALYLLSVPLLLAAFGLFKADESNNKANLRFRMNLLLLMVLIVALGGPLIKVIWPIIQLSGTLLFLMAAAIYCLEHKYYYWVGTLSFLALYKPQTGLPLLAGLVLWGVLVAEARWQLLKGFLAVAVPLTLVAFWLEPNWIGDWLESLNKIAATSKSYQINYISNLPLVVSVGIGLLLALLNLGVWLLAVKNYGRSDFYLGQALTVTTLTGLFLIPRTGNYDLIFNLVALSFALAYFTNASSDPPALRKLGLSLSLGASLLYSILYLVLDRNLVFLLSLASFSLITGTVSLHYWQTHKQATTA